MRAVLVVNPSATTTTTRTRDVLCRALGSEAALEVAETRRRGHAAALAQRCAGEGVDVIVVLGGDGTLNEVVNGVLADGPRAGLPGLAVIPGGSTNVFARALGLPRDPVEATGAVLEALRSGSRRTVGVGRADDRYFTFCAGLGIDAEIVRAVDAKRAAGVRLSAGVHMRTLVRYLFTASDRRHPSVRLDRAGHPPETGLYCAVVQNTAPWTYAGDRPMHACPDASFDTGLDLFALRSMRTTATAGELARMLGLTGRSSRTAPRDPRTAMVLHDLGAFTVSASRPLPHQVDGEYVGEREQVTFRSVPRALEVVL